MKYTNKLLSALLTLALALAPTAAIPALADGAEAPGISFGAADVAKDDIVWLGTRDLSPIAWRVLSQKGDTTNDVSGADDILLISKYTQGYTPFETDSNTSNDWAGSDAQVWCTDYCNSWPEGVEKAAIRETTVTEESKNSYNQKPFFYQGGYNTYYFDAASLKNERFFFLSAKEAETYFTKDADRKAYATPQWESSKISTEWWLRSHDVRDGKYVGYVEKSYGRVYTGSNAATTFAARPACNLDTGRILFASAAEGVKTSDNSFDTVAANASGEWKLTLLDSGRGFSVTENKAVAAPGGKVTLTYTGSTVGSNEYVSAILCDSTGTPMYYTGVKAPGAGTVSFTLPKDIPLGKYTLKVFNEQRNGGKLSDYASELRDVALTVAFIGPGVAFGAAGVPYGNMVWFGTNTESTEAAPIAWRVLSAAGDATLPVSGADDVLLISEYTQGSTYFKKGESNNAWEGSDAQDWCRSFYTSWPASEKPAIRETSVAETEKYTVYSSANTYSPTPLTNEHFFFLSAKEADKFFADSADRVAYESMGSENAKLWWIRSAVYNRSMAGRISVAGNIGYFKTDSTAGARPAFNLNTDSVLFASAAVGGKVVRGAGILSSIAQNTSLEWKLTLLDEGRSGFDVKEKEVRALPGDDVTLRYSGAKTGANEYVSVLVCDSTGKALYYGCSAAQPGDDGTVSFSLPPVLEFGSYTLRVFNEQKNGDYWSDYSSAFEDVTLTVSRDAGLYGRLDGTTLTCSVFNVPEGGALLLAAWYDAGGMMLGVTAETVDEGDTKDVVLDIDSGAVSCKLFLVGADFVPLCAAVVAQ